jgi:hypothetical protein
MRATMPVGIRTLLCGSCSTAALLSTALVACSDSSSTATDPSHGAAAGVVYGTPGDTAVGLGWSASPDPRVKGYRVYYGSAPRYYFQRKGAGVDVGRATAYHLSNLQASTTYYFAVTAYDEAGHESEYSNEVAKVIR